MSTPPAIEFVHLQPKDTRYAQPLQAFFSDTWDGLYKHELGAIMHNLATPDDPAVQADKISHSGNLAVPSTSAYVLALDRMQKRYSGIIGAAKLRRYYDNIVEIEEIDVALDRRGEGIGPGMLDFALGSLAINPSDTLRLEVLRQNGRAINFWLGLGFNFNGVTVHNREVFPDPEWYHHVLFAAAHVVRAKVGARVRPLPERP